MVASRDPELETPGPEDLYDVGVVGHDRADAASAPDGTLRILVQGAQRVRIDRWVREEPYLVAEISELPDVVEETPELTALMPQRPARRSRDIVEQVPYLPEELQLAVANIDDPSALSPPDRRRRCGSRPRRSRSCSRRSTSASACAGCPRSSRASSRSSRSARRSSRRSSPSSTRRQREYFLRQQLKAIQEELGEVDEMQAEANELREQLDAIDLPEEVRRQVDRELARLEKLPPGLGRARRDPHLARVDRLAAVGQVDRGQPRPRHARGGPRRGPLRHRAGQGPHPRVPRRAQAQARRPRLHPLLRRPARRGQDVAGPLDRPRAGAQVRAHQRGRRARRGRDPRPPAHLHRRDARARSSARCATRGRTTRCS